MRQTRQGGSSLTFILVGVLLAALLVGGVYILRQQTAQKPAATPEIRSEPAPVADKPEDKKSEPSPSSTQTEDTTTRQSDADKKEVQPASAQPSAAELPRTGGLETIGVALSTAILSGVIVAYVRSRRAAYLAF